MGTTRLQALPADHKRVIVNELVRGRKRATELQSLLNNNNNNHGGGSTSRSAEELLMGIMTSFTAGLSVLSASTRMYGGGGGDDDYQFSGSGTTTTTTTTTSCGGGREVVKAEEHSHCGNRSSEDSGESRKRPGLKDRRGCYKRRKNSESWAKISSSLDDGQAWRKYGQKEILNAPYPRAYFRCTRKLDQGCRAIKQVQQLQDTPKMYKITYIGNHTCTNNTVRGHPQIMTMAAASDPPARNPHAPPPRPSSSSESGSAKKEQHHASSSAMIPFLSMKAEEECKQEWTTWSDVTDNNVNDTSDVWPEYFNYNDFRVFPADTEDVVSNMQYCLDMDINFSSEFNFDEVVFP